MSIPDSGAFSYMDRDWVRDAAGIAHAIRSSEWPHHSAHCGKYVHGDYLPPALNIPDRCRECCRRIEHVYVGAGGEIAAQAIARGRGIGSKRRNGVNLV